VIATHGRAFWVLDNITSLRQIAAGANADKAKLFAPAVAVRVDNDSFLGSPFPPEEPMAKNPPNGAIVDYYLPAKAGKVTLEVKDSNGKLVRRYVSGEKKGEPAPPLPIAERWLPKPQVLEAGSGMHRFVWDLRWSAAGLNEESDDDSIEVAGGPRVAPGSYQVRLMVDGTTFTEPLQVKMDPRSKATAAELAEQQQLGLEIFGETRRVRQAQDQMKAAKEALDKVKQKVKEQLQLTVQIEKILADITDIDSGGKSNTMGLRTAGSGLQAALRVVESGDRAVPQQAMEVYRTSDEAAKSRIAEWQKLQSGELAELNRELKKAGQAAIP
jgi:hypothetical protein